MYNILIDGQNLKVEDKLERGRGYIIWKVMDRLKGQSQDI
jgi:hypothetical protein